ncbi:latex serine proteinase inhibitor [Nicotiana tabacum]|uniref:Latex serine proteinase inhibitor n=1 Tax=Nicotiana tabacum TaxID=4097 RepID=A0A1S4A735_TOBAC|nr:latex serine proteinase inhibitor-like [Nicotiana tomentosiformis]XP_016472435.1 PREDICTED: latex serine proteinase inhibitor-like [Nicotiana tabacum]
MKTVLLFLSLAFLPFSALATCSTDIPNQLLRVVKDLKGHPLDKNARYFIVSAFNGAGGGGVRLANLGGQEENTCLTSVVQSPRDTDEGIAVYFKPKEPKHQQIVESASLNINFYLDYIKCANLTVWKVDHYPKPAEHYTISTGAKLANPLDVNSWFQIKSLGSSYKLVFCPYGETFTCHNVGIVNESGYRRLVLTENAKAFVFIKDCRVGKAEA